MNTDISLTVVIVTYNASRWINKCMDTLTISNIPTSILVIDNNSNDTTINIIRSKYALVSLIINKENLGFGRANNIGLKYAVENNSDYVFLLNQDAYTEPDTIEKLVEFHKSNPDYGIISPVHLNGNKSELDPNFAKCVQFKTLSEININSIKAVDTDFVNAASWLISRECLNKVGGFDPLFTHYGEDRDYCYRAAFHNFKIGVVLDSFICHDRSYNQVNEFRKYRSTLFNAGLAHIKDIRHKLVINYGGWIMSRLRKIIKYAMQFDFSKIMSEISVIISLIAYCKRLKNSRKISKEYPAPYLN